MAKVFHEKKLCFNKRTIERVVYLWRTEIVLDYIFIYICRGLLLLAFKTVLGTN